MCVNEIFEWMLQNNLKRNKKKTELLPMVFYPKCLLIALLRAVSVARALMKPWKNARNIGVILEQANISFMLLCYAISERRWKH